MHTAPGALTLVATDKLLGNAVCSVLKHKLKNWK